MHKNQPQTKIRISSSHTHNGATTAYWRSVRHCTAQPDGITEIAHANGLVESFDLSGRPLGLYRLRGTPRPANKSVPKRGDLRMLPCHKIIAGPTVIKADGTWKIIHCGGITERFPATRNCASDEAGDTICYVRAEPNHALAA